MFIGVLNSKDNWKREDVGREIQEGETYTTQFKAPYAGEWKVMVRLAGQLDLSEAANLVKDPGAEGDERARYRECDVPLGWGCYEGAGTAEWGVTTDEAHRGKKSVSMKVTGHDERPITNSALTLGATAGYSGAGAFDVRANTTYRFSFWLKGRGFKRKLKVYGQGWREPVDKAASRQQLLSTLSSVQPTDEWQHHEGSFTTKADTRKAALFVDGYGNRAHAPVGATIGVDDVFVGLGIERTPSRLLHSRVQVEPGQPFTFRSPGDGKLDYVLLYLWDRTAKTPRSVWTPMDVYRQAIQGAKR